MSTWNGNKFSIYKSDEKQVLKLIKELGDQVNHNTTDKTDKFGDHAGSWQGVSKPTLSNEGIATVVDDLVVNVNELKDTTENLTVDLETVDYNLSDIFIDDYISLFIGNDITIALRQSLSDAVSGATIKFNPLRIYEISDTIVIDKPVILDFDNADVALEVDNDVVFDLRGTGESDIKGRIKLINFNFTKTLKIPTKVIYINGAINSVIDGTFENIYATHSLIHNYAGYGTKIYGEARWSNCPQVIYLSSSSTPPAHSFAIDINMDITGNNGKGIVCEGGNGNIKGVIESCGGGGFEFTGDHLITGLNIMVHFEYNDTFDLKLGKSTYDTTGATGIGIINLIGVHITRNRVTNNILVGHTQTLTVIGCYLPGQITPLTETSHSTCNVMLMNNNFIGAPRAAYYKSKDFVLLNGGVFEPYRLRLKSPNGTSYNIKVSDAGVLTAEAI